MAELGEIKRIAGRADDQQETVDVERAALKEIFDAAKVLHGVVPSALKAVMKLRKLESHKMQAWLRTFDEARAALGLDDQLDLEDAVRAMDDAADRTGGPTIITDGDTGEVLAEFGSKARKARGQARTTEETKEPGAVH